MNIRFSHHYRKLNDRLFTTIRPHNINKERFYRQGLGKDFSIVVQGEEIENATLLHLEKVHMQNLSKEFIDYDTEGIYKLPNRGTMLLLIFKLHDNGAVII